MLPQPPPMQAPPVLEPKSIKVFGIIHIVFGGLGLLMSLFSIVILIGIPFLLTWATETMAKDAKPGDPGTEAIMKMLNALKTRFADLTIPNWVHTITSIVVAILILLAGIALVKKRKGAVAKSNRYVWCSIGAKVINLALFFAMGMAANDKYQEAVAGLSGAATRARGPGGLDMAQLQSMISSGGAVLSIALSLVYPILVLVMLNKPNVKEFLRQQGT